MNRTISRTGLTIIFFYAIAAAAQVVVPAQQTPTPAGIPSEAITPQPTATPAGLPDEGSPKKPDADAPGTTSGPDSSKPELLSRASSNDGVRIGGGDLLLVSVLGAADYNHEVRVATDGSVNLPFLGPVKVVGLTPREVAADLQRRLSQGGYFNNPQVSVFVKEYATQGVSVLGEVQKPGVYPLYSARTLFDVLSAAQGTTPIAGNRVYITHRDRPQQPEIVKLSYDPSGAAHSNVPVLPGDTIIVQKASMMYVVGNVQKPTGIAMVDPGLTVLKAIALAQGIAPNAALDRARLVRKTSDGQVAIPLQLKKMLAAQVPDMRVEPDDVLFIPNSAAMSAVKKGLEIALQTASGVVIYRQY